MRDSIHSFAGVVIAGPDPAFSSTELRERLEAGSVEERISGAV
jgi:hypothetical protein